MREGAFGCSLTYAAAFDSTAWRNGWWYNTCQQSSFAECKSVAQFQWRLTHLSHLDGHGRIPFHNIISKWVENIQNTGRIWDHFVSSSQSVWMPENADIFCTMISNFIHTYFSNSKTPVQSLEWLSACNSTCWMQIPCRFIKTSTAKVSFGWHVFASGIIGPYFFQEGNCTVTITSEWTEMLELNGGIWFQQYTSTTHIAQELNCLTVMFHGHLILHFGGNVWSSTSPDLMAPNSFLWGYLKSKVYIDEPRVIT